MLNLERISNEKRVFTGINAGFLVVTMIAWILVPYTLLRRIMISYA
jgi:hypothetical protein